MAVTWRSRGGHAASLLLADAVLQLHGRIDYIWLTTLFELSCPFCCSSAEMGSVRFPCDWALCASAARACVPLVSHAIESFRFFIPNFVSSHLLGFSSYLTPRVGFLAELLVRTRALAFAYL